jgi:hypothetical protein
MHGPLRLYEEPLRRAMQLQLDRGEFRYKAIDDYLGGRHIAILGGGDNGPANILEVRLKQPLGKDRRAAPAAFRAARRIAGLAFQEVALIVA